MYCLVIFRYRNFRTFASPRPVQFSSVALDPSGEVVCAGSHDTCEVFVWSVQTGRLLEVGWGGVRWWVCNVLFITASYRA